MRHGATKRTQGDTTGALTQQVVRKQQERLADLRPADFEACQCAPQRRGPPPPGVRVLTGPGATVRLARARQPTRAGGEEPAGET
jgi:hypothetical protein